MSLRRFGTATAALGLATALIAPSAMAGTTPGERSLAAVLTADGNTFDRNWYDYDLVTEAVLAVLDANPNSGVALLADGSTPLTAFIPNDRAFQVLVRDLTKRWYTSESQVFSALVDAVGVEGVEQVLLYHVVPDATITKKDAVAANGATLTTAQGGTITVKVYNRSVPVIVLRDQDRDDINPFLNPRALDINAGNKQIAHGIVFVLRPFDL